LRVVAVLAQAAALVGEASPIDADAVGYVL
jgi:hypothetical protein